MWVGNDVTFTLWTVLWLDDETEYAAHPFPELPAGLNSRLLFAAHCFPQELCAAHNDGLQPALHVTATKFLVDLPSRLVRSFFAPTIGKIAKCLRGLKREPALKDLKHVFLVGGFSRCHLVEAAARAVFDGDICSVIVDLRPDVAIAKGAALFANNQSAFVRLAKLTYGVKTTRLYDPKNPQHVKRRLTRPLLNADGEEVLHTFSTHIKMDKRIPADGTCPKHCYGPLLAHQTMVTFEILASHEKDIEFPDKDITFPLGEVTVELDMKASFDERGIEAEFIFGKAELLLKCVRVATGEQVANVAIRLVQEMQEL